VATSAGINYLYQQKSLKLWLIDAGYQVIFLGIFGAIMGAWH
jgi:anti-sigma-K factor RskA